MAVDPGGKFAYVTSSGSNDVSMYTINGTTGALDVHWDDRGRSFFPILGGRGFCGQVRLCDEFQLELRLDIHHQRHHRSPNVGRNNSLSGSSPNSIVDPSFLGRFAYVTNSGLERRLDVQY